MEISQNIDAVEKVRNDLMSVRLALGYGADRLVRAFMEFKFDGVRYYEVARDLAAQEPLLVLSRCAGDKCSDDWIGWTIPHRQTTHAKGKNPSMPVVGSLGDGRHGEKERDWIEKFSLEDQSWVDIPLYSHGELQGLVACNWKGDANLLSNADQIILALVASEIANRYRLENSLYAKAAFEEFTINPDHDNDLNQLAIDGCRHIAQRLSSATAAVFEYQWSNNNLRKIYEFIDPRIPDISSALKENYSVSEYLTGTAWTDAKYRHVVNFKLFNESQKHQIFQPSYEYHTAILGSITSVMYGIIGDAEKRYLIRLINRCDHPRLPLSASHFDVLSTFCSELSRSVDRSKSIIRLSNVQRTVRDVIEKLSISRDTLAIIESSLKDEGASEFFCLCHTEGQKYYCFEHYSDLSLQQKYEVSKYSRRGKPWSEDYFYTSQYSSNTPKLFDLRSLAHHDRNDRLTEDLLSVGIEKLWVFPIRSGRIRGVLGCPFRAEARSGSNVSAARMPETLKTALTTYASIIGSSIEVAESHMTTEGALNLVGHIGHEVTTPSAELGQAALFSLELARDTISADQTDLIDEIDNQEAIIKFSMEDMAKTMELAQAVALQRSGRLRVNFRRADLHDILNASKESLRNEMHTDDQGVIRRYNITFNSSCRNLGILVCDPDFIKRVFVNLLRNAMKYSFPQHPQESMEVKVLGIPQSQMSIIQVINWGLGIPKEEFELIFKPLVRGSNHDRVKRIGGMGLGLYLARGIVNAHGGELFCRSSEPTFSDPEKIKNLEGYETCFEIRLPHVNRVGTRDLPWEA